MTDGKQDQEQPGIIEETGITEKKEKRLTLEAEKLIRGFMIKWVSLPAIFLAVISFALGFFIEKVAFQTASNQAFQSAQSEVMKLIEHVMEAKHTADTAAGAIQSSSIEISKSQEKAKKFSEEVSSLQSKLASTIAFQASDPQIKRIADALAGDPRIANILNGLDKSVQIRLQKADEQINQIKGAYKIDVRGGEIDDIAQHKKVFTFPFSVKHSWIEFTASIDEPYRCLTLIKGNTVTVSVEAIDHRSAPFSKKTIRRYENPAAYRVWATSF